jgi:hypothetical protein
VDTPSYSGYQEPWHFVWDSDGYEAQAGWDDVELATTLALKLLRTSFVQGFEVAGDRTSRSEDESGGTDTGFGLGLWHSLIRQVYDSIYSNQPGHENSFKAYTRADMVAMNLLESRRNVSATKRRVRAVDVTHSSQDVPKLTKDQVKAFLLYDYKEGKYIYNGIKKTPGFRLADAIETPEVTPEGEGDAAPE